jgi:hypothetical protein
MPETWKRDSRISASCGGGDAGWDRFLGIRDQAESQTLAVHFCFAKILAGGNHSAFEENGVDVEASGAAEGAVGGGEAAGKGEAPAVQAAEIALQLDCSGHAGTNCGAGNSARSRLSTGSGRLKGGCGQDWPPHDSCKLAVGWGRPLSSSITGFVCFVTM